MIQYHFTVMYHDGEVKKYLDPNFQERVQKLLRATKEPLCLYLKPNEKLLYFERESFEAYANEHIPQTELIKQTQTDGLFRNKYTVYDEHGNIDKGSLWKRHGNELVLVDNDRYVNKTYHHLDFIEV